MNRTLEEIESGEVATLNEWCGVLHETVMDWTHPMERRIRALKQMDRITGEDGELTEHAVRFYVQQSQLQGASE